MGASANSLYSRQLAGYEEAPLNAEQDKGVWVGLGVDSLCSGRCRAVEGRFLLERMEGRSFPVEGGHSILERMEPTALLCTMVIRYRRGRRVQALL